MSQMQSNIIIFAFFVWIIICFFEVFENIFINHLLYFTEDLFFAHMIYY